MRFKLTPKTISLYEQVLRDHEKIEITKDSIGFKIEGEYKREYRFKEDYYFLVGDDRMNSVDSKFLGFFAENQMLDKIVYWF